ncbi:MAG: ATP synthase F0 subunit C [Blautia sp.]|nr:ATP synthase F0 subunit C [Blautia sp.]
MRKTKTISKSIRLFAAVAALLLLFSFGASSAVYASAEDTAQDEQTIEVTQEDNGTNSKAYAAALCVGLAAATGAISMSIAISKATDGIARQPEADGKIRTSLMLGLVFIETAIIYALIIGILIIFVL